MEQIDSALVELATEGDADAIETIVSALSRPVYNLALRMLHAHHDAEDATQEAVLRVVTNLSSFRGDSRFSTWAWSVATRAVLDHARGRARRAALTAQEFGDDLADGLASTSTPDPETAALLSQVKLGCGRAMLQTLDGDLRVAYTLGEILELDQREAAAALGISDAAYRKRLSRARTRLRAVLDENCGIVDSANACRCIRRRERAVSLGRLEPRDAVDLDVDELATMIDQLEGLGRVAAYFRADPMIDASDRLLPRIREVIGAS